MHNQVMSLPAIQEILPLVFYGLKKHKIAASPEMFRQELSTLNNDLSAYLGDLSLIDFDPTHDLLIARDKFKTNVLIDCNGRRSDWPTDVADKITTAIEKFYSDDNDIAGAEFREAIRILNHRTQQLTALARQSFMQNLDDAMANQRSAESKNVA